MTRFTDRQFADAYPAGVGRNFWNLARNMIVERTLRRHDLAGAAILEVGCGTGVVVGFLRQAGMTCWGCELGDPGVDESGGFVFSGQDAALLPDDFRRKIEVLMLCDVIEHVVDPAGFVAGLRAAFPRAHSLLVTVPAHRELWSNYDTYFGHLRRYDIAALQAELAAAGFALEGAAYFFKALYPVMWAINALGRRRSVALTPTRSPRLDALLAHLFRLEHRLLPADLPGTSLIAVGRRT